MWENQLPRALLHLDLLGLRAGGLEVVDVEADVVELRRGRVALEEMELLVAEAQPLDRVPEVRARIRSIPKISV